MKSILSNKTVRIIFLVSLMPYAIVGLLNTAHAETVNTTKHADKLAEAKPAEIKAADPMAKAPSDADFKKLDGNSDGKISLKEAVKDKSLASAFDATDANHDGMIAADEYANYKAASAIKGTEPSAVTPVTN